MPQAQAPTPTLPRAEVMARGPVEGLKEIRTSLSDTLANIEATLPAPPAGPAVTPPTGLPMAPPAGVAAQPPKLSGVFQSIEATIKPPVEISKVAESVEERFPAPPEGGGSPAGKEEGYKPRGSETKEKEKPPTKGGYVPRTPGE